MLAINQVNYFFIFGFGDKINFDVHPWTGRIGLATYDIYPNLSAGIMIFHKFAPFLIFAVYAHRISFFNPIPMLHSHHEKKDKESTDKKLEEKNISPEWYKTKFFWWNELMTFSLLLYFVMTCLSVYIMYSVAGRDHAIQEAIVTILLFGVICIIYFFLQALSSYRNFYLHSNFKSDSTGKHLIV